MTIKTVNERSLILTAIVFFASIKVVGFVSALENISISANGVIVYGFRETCNTWDTTKWGQEYNRPAVVDGTWVFDFPSEGVYIIHAHRREASGYGVYKFRIKTSGPRVTGIRYYVHLLWGEPLNELDIPELFGAHESNVLSISTFRDGIGKYWYFTSDELWEDGNYHEWKFVYTAERLEFYLDEALLFSYDEDPNNPVLAKPPMYLYVGGNAKGYQTSGFTFTVDEIEYQPQ